MERIELVRRLVLNSICDDWENVDQIILREVATDGNKLGLTIDRSDVISALASLVEDGLAKAAILSSSEPFKELRMPPADEIEDYYFYITDKGMRLHLSDDTWWPFPDED